MMLTTINVQAQDTMYVHQQGGTLTRIAVNKIDSIVFYNKIINTPPIGTLTTGSATDYDGNNYKTITIGTQTWMAENLKVTKYNDGTTIPNITTGWGSLTSGAQCDYNNSPANTTTYGKLYNWNAVNTGKLCPTGWHVPSTDEWSTLSTYLGGDAGDKLKEIGTTHWNSPNTATNTSGFTALPGGERNNGGGFDEIGYCGKWWNSNGDPFRPDYMILNNDRSVINNGSELKSFGYSVRCLKD